MYLVGDKTLAQSLAQQVSRNQLPADRGRAILTEMVGLSEDTARSIIDPAEQFTPPIVSGPGLGEGEQDPIATADEGDE